MQSTAPPPAPHPSLFLIGPMGSGKSAVGKTLARLCGLRFIDSDSEIERRTGVDIPFIFEKEGEAGFRVREREVIDDLTQVPGIVLATGGGAVLLPENRAHLATRGIVVYLEASIEQQVERTRHGRHRPLLLNADPAERLTELMRIREPLYRSIARIAVPTDRRKVQTVAEDIMASLGRLTPEPAPQGGAPGFSD
ncbi:MAG: shikimate kinase AroK [Proteobacteria bacterium]|nr:shikimate kinase AroK [Pseudomonadota bacterium]